MQSFYSRHCLIAFRHSFAGLFLALLTGQVYAAQSVVVNANGSPSFSYAISAPPGIAGMQPELALFYNANSVNGPVGYGWSLQGVSMITRCQGNRQIDGYRASVTYSPDDKLCLDGQRLLQTDENGNVFDANSGSGNLPGFTHPFQSNDSLGLASGLHTEYRTINDSFARIRAYGSAGGDAKNGPSYFKVWTRNGQILEYGVNNNATANAQINVAGSGIVAAWPVSRVNDKSGNYIDFQYTQRGVAWGSVPSAGTATAHEWNLAEVRYTGNVNTGQLPSNKMVFHYSDRPDTPGAAQDRAETYHEGRKNVSIQLLNTVSTYVNWPADHASQPENAVAVKNINLAYATGSTSHRSTLHTITECAGSTSTCLPPTTFNYSAGGGVAYTTSTAFQNGPLASLPMQNSSGVGGASTVGFIAGDFFGSGRLDMLSWVDTPANLAPGNQLFQNTGNGNFVKANTFNLGGINLNSSNGCYVSIAADFNGDGLTDILRAMTQSAGCGAANNILYISNGEGSFSVAPLPSIISLVQKSQVTTFDTHPFQYTLSEGSNFYILDANNDGVLDIVTTIWPNFTYPFGVIPANDAALCATQICTHVYFGQAGGGFAEQIPNSLNHRSVYATPSLPPGQQFNLRPYVEDINSDGLSDLVVNTGNWVSRGDGSFALLPYASNSYGAGCLNRLDFNGDGRIDCIYAYDNASNQCLYIGAVQNIGLFASNFNLTTPGHELFGMNAASKQNIGMRSADVDGDGRSDIVRWEDNPALNMVYLSNGDGTFRTSNSGLTAYQLQKSDGTASFVTGDFLGNGNTEILNLTTNGSAVANRLLVKSDATPPDQLVSVVSGTGLTTWLNWVTPANSASGSLGLRYTSDRGTPNAAIYPVLDVAFPMQIVATVTTETGTGATLAAEYGYRGAKYAFDGRGWLGFRNTLAQSMAPNDTHLTLSTDYLMTTPYIGRVMKSELRIGTINTATPQVLSTVSTIYCDSTSSTAPTSATLQSPCAAFPYPRQMPYRPYAYQTMRSDYDLNGTALPTVSTISTYNASGDPTQITVSTTGTALGRTDTFVKTTTNTYLSPDTSGDAWLLGRLQNATVTASVSNDIASITTSPGNAGWDYPIWNDPVPPVVIDPEAKALATWLIPMQMLSN